MAVETRGHVKSSSADWNTPPKYVDAIKHFFGGSISLDPCSNETSIVGADTEFKLPSQDGLLEDWERYETVFVNPPYGRDRERGTSIADWLRKCSESSEMGCEVIALVPVATNTNHWKKWVFGKASCVCFLYDTRLKFLENGVESKKGAPMACALVYWGNMPKKFVNVFSAFGAAIDISEVSTPMGDRP
jgi:hypothetical protein